MSDRKYRHRGYMDSDREPQRREPQGPKPQSKPQDREGPRSPRMMAFGETVKCAMCGAKAPSNITAESTCASNHHRQPPTTFTTEIFSSSSYGARKKIFFRGGKAFSTFRRPSAAGKLSTIKFPRALGGSKLEDEK